MVDREAMVGVVFYLDTGFEPLHPTVLRMSRLEFDALKLRAAQQAEEGNKRDQFNNANLTFTLGGNVYTNEYLLWLLSERHQTGDLPTQQQWAEAKIRREKAERDRRENDRKRRAEEEAYRRQQGSYARYDQFGNPYFSYTMGGSNPFEDFIRAAQGASSATGSKFNSDKRKLADLAGVEWADADNMKLELLKKKAMRKCHPDTGGSHQKWLELTNLLESMGLKL